MYQRHIRSLRDITDDTVRDLNQRIYPETGYENEDGYQEIIVSTQVMIPVHLRYRYVSSGVSR